LGEREKMSTRFSIIITFYNQRGFIKDALDSALSQQNAEFEVIVVDDCSNDGSQEILKAYGDAIRLVCHKTNQGVGAARNSGASLATGNYLLFHDGDDLFLPWTLDVFERVIQAKNPKLVLGGFWWFDGTPPALQPADIPHEIRIFEYRDYLRRDRPFGKAICKVVDRQAFESVNGWPTDYKILEDLDFLIRLSACGRTILIQSPLTIFYRRHPENNLRRNRLTPIFLAIRTMVANERFGKYPGGKHRSFERKAMIGGLVLFWGRDAFRVGMYWEGAKFLAYGGTMALAAVTQRLGMILRGRQPCEVIKM
jgi:glycosyltransferase involved in cell wall biosynthesis